MARVTQGRWAGKQASEQCKDVTEPWALLFLSAFVELGTCHCRIPKPRQTQEIEKHNVVIPDKVAGWLLLRRAGLTFEQKQMVQSRASDLSQSGVTEALYFLFGQDYRGKTSEGRQWKAGKGYNTNAARRRPRQSH